MSENIKWLVELKQSLEDLVANKSGQIEQLKKEIENLQQQIGIISQQISTHSFVSADSLLDTESFMKSIPSTTPPTSNIMKKIFSTQNELLASVQYEKDIILVRFILPERVKVTPEKYITFFVKDILINLKKNEPNLSVKYTKKTQDNQDFIETITLQRIHQYESFEMIYDGIQRLIAEKLNN
jgi:hypothetical protein